MDGIIIVNKEKNMTSRDVVNELCKIFNTKKVGHTGTLDPMAEGVLVVAFGKSLKIVEDITSLNKSYEAEITLGIETDTLDTTGNIINTVEKIDVSEEQIDLVLNSFIGKYNMEVPKYSAIKVNGKKLYEYARNNEDIKLPIKEVFINDLKRISKLKLENNKIIFSIYCDVSKGTYIRSLIRDISKKLNTIGSMSKLIRVKQGNFDIKDSYTLKNIKEGNYKVLSMEESLDLPIIEVDEYLSKKILNGCKLENRYNYEKFCFMHNKKILAIYIIDDKDKNIIRPKKVFNV